MNDIAVSSSFVNDKHILCCKNTKKGEESKINCDLFSNECRLIHFFIEYDAIAFVEEGYGEVGFHGVLKEVAHFHPDHFLHIVVIADDDVVFNIEVSC